MIAYALVLAGGVCCGFAMCGIFLGYPADVIDLLFFAGNSCFAAYNAMTGYWVLAAWSIAAALLCLFTWWHRRRRRKRAPRSYGYKARALLKAITRKAREALRPRPVLQPAPV